MSTKVVVPDSIISTAASRVPTRTSSGDTVLASAGKMYCSSHWRSARPRYITIGACVWVLISPGSTTRSRASIVSAAWYFDAIAAGLPTSTMSMPSIATAPGVRIAWVAFSVTTVPPVTTSDT